MMGGDAIQTFDERGEPLVGDSLLVLMNADASPVAFKLPAGAGEGPWILELDTNEDDKAPTPCVGDYRLAPRSTVILRQPLPEDVKRAAAVRPRAQPSADIRSLVTSSARRAGVLLPLFSMRRPNGWGVGDIGDIPHFARWAARAGFSVVQLLPVNAVSPAGPSPYGAVSAFALDPVYLCLDECEDFVSAGGRASLPPAASDDLGRLAWAPAVAWTRVRAAKREGLRVAFQRFVRDEWKPGTARARQLRAYISEQRTWLDDYALYASIHERLQKSWTDWPLGLRERTPDAIAEERSLRGDAWLEQVWTQWQLDLQWRRARRAALAEGVELMGDLPFTVAVDSADAWAHPSVFRLDLRVETPDVEGSSQGQDGGLPAYDWPALQRSDFAWMRARAVRAAELFSLYRVDHVLGLYRTFFRASDGCTSGFTPSDERAQVRLGEGIVRLMQRFAQVVAEDLGAVPGFLRPSLERAGVPGYRVLRWEKDGEHYRDPSTWPALSVATSSTHDTDSMADWFDGLSPEDRARLLAMKALDSLRGRDPRAHYDDAVRDGLLGALYAAPSVLVIVPLQDALGTRERINRPGTAADANWNYRMATDIDALAADSTTIERLAQLSAQTERMGKR